MENACSNAQIRRQPTHLPEHLNQRLCRYAESAVATATQASNWNLPAAVTVSAVGLGVLALPPFAAAEIVYTPAHQSVFHFKRGGLIIDLNNDGVPDGSLYVYGSSRSYQVNRELSAFARLGNGLAVSAQGYASALALGAVIGPAARFALQADMARCEIGESSGGQIVHSSRGPWPSVQNRYLGFKFQINGETHYAWARFSTSGFPEPPNNLHYFVCNAKATLTGYAYETIPDKPILAGIIPYAESNTGNDSVPDFKPPDVKVPTLGVLASGAAALDLWRRRPADTHSIAATQ